MEHLGSMLDYWRAHVDECLVQLDLAHLEVRDRFEHQKNHSESAEFGAHLEKKIAELRRSLARERQAVVEMKHDVAQAAAGAWARWMKERD